MQNKLLIIITSILVAGAAAYYFVAQAPEATAPTDPFANLTLEVERQNLSAELKTQYEAEIADYTAKIVAGEAAGEYVLQYYFQRGINYQRLGKLKIAFDDFTTVVAGDPSNETAWNNLGELMIEMGNPIDAEGYFLKAVEAYPVDTTYNKLYRYWTEYRPLDRFEAVGPMLEAALEEIGPNASFYVKLGRWYMAKEDYERAVEAYRQAAVLNPDNEAIKEELREALEAR